MAESNIKPTSFRFTDEDMEKLRMVVDHAGINRVAVVRMLLTDYIRREIKPGRKPRKKSDAGG